MSMRKYDHTRWDVEAETKIDPDDGNSMLCEACCLPIFYTPPFFPTTVINCGRALHDQCANDLPPKLEGRHPLHPKKELILQTNNNNNNNNKCCCSRCDSICGGSYYECGDDDCDFRLDLGCALTIKIVHRSHPHRLTAIKGRSLSSLLCAACGTRHHQQPGPEAISTWQVWYVCSPCDFWLHPDCAILPNAIKIDDNHHPHHLLLMYLNQGATIVECGICGHIGESSGWGIYVCFHCIYAVHTKCVIYSDPDHRIHFEPVKVRDAQVPGLLHLPMPNESTSVMAHILTNTAAITLNGGASPSNISSTTSGSMMSKDQIHEHPLILHDHDDPAAGVARICNACVHLISSSDPYYGCSTTFNNNNKLDGCRDFFLHRCCAHLPTKLTANPQHPHNVMYRNEMSLTLVSKPNLRGRPFNMFKCAGCKRQCNGFAYACAVRNLYMDVVCAFMHTSITHDGHAKSHILHPFNYWASNMCICCGHPMGRWSDPEIGYECRSCRDFNIHAMCALLPDTVTHKFDTHPLKLITTTCTQTLIIDHEKKEETMFCEICENDIDDKRTWYYSCKKCDQYFHTGCIPCVDELSKIKFGFTIRVTCHDCPLTCVRALSIDGYRCQCGHCERIIITESDEIAFECSDCYFRIRKECATRETLMSRS